MTLLNNYFSQATSPGQTWAEGEVTCNIWHFEGNFSPNIPSGRSMDGCFVSENSYIHHHQYHQLCKGQQPTPSVVEIRHDTRFFILNNFWPNVWPGLSCIRFIVQMNDSCLVWNYVSHVIMWRWKWSWTLYIINIKHCWCWRKQHLDIFLFEKSLVGLNGRFKFLGVQRTTSFRCDRAEAWSIW